MKRSIRALSQQPNVASQQRNINRVSANIYQVDIQQYVASMRSRRQAVISANGGHTRY